MIAYYLQDGAIMNCGIKAHVLEEIKELAVSGGKIDLFSLAVEEETSTLLKYDVVNLEGSVQRELLDSIEKEGILLYEKV